LHQKRNGETSASVKLLRIKWLANGVIAFVGVAMLHAAIERGSGLSQATCIPA